MHALTSQPLQPHPVPTVGFTLRKVKVGGVVIKCWDLGGQPRVRNLWERYSRGVDVIVWVVDSDDVDGLETAREEMGGLLGKASLRGIPCLIVGNKCDLEGSLGTEQLKEHLFVDELAGEEDREIVVFSASCLTGDGIKSIVTWLGNKGR